MEETLKKQVRSKGEKELLKYVIDISEPLPFKLERHTDDVFEDELYYIIPDDQKEEVLKKAWPFAGIPKMDKRLLDIHEDALVKLKECFIIRWQQRNIIVSPHYFHSGGTLIDLIDDEKNGRYTVALDVIKE